MNLLLADPGPSDGVVAVLLGAFGGMLALYAFLYNALKEAAFDALKKSRVQIAESSNPELVALRGSLRKARRPASALATIPFVLALLCLPAVVGIVRDLDPHASFSTLKALFVLLTCCWVGVTVLMAVRLGQILQTLRVVEKTVRKL